MGNWWRKGRMESNSFPPDSTLSRNQITISLQEMKIDKSLHLSVKKVKLEKHGKTPSNCSEPWLEGLAHVGRMPGLHWAMQLRNQGEHLSQWKSKMKKSIFPIYEKTNMKKSKEEYKRKKFAHGLPFPVGKWSDLSTTVKPFVENLIAFSGRWRNSSDENGSDR